MMSVAVLAFRRPLETSLTTTGSVSMILQSGPVVQVGVGVGTPVPSRREHQAPALGAADPKAILVALPTWVGDFVMATPTLRAIRNRFEDAHIVALREPNLRDLLRGGDWMNECVDWPPKDQRSLLHRATRELAWGLRERKFDWAILLPNSFRSALIAWLANAKRRFGYDRDGRGFLLTDRLPVKNRRPSKTTRVVAGGIPAPPGPYIPMRLVDYYGDLAEFIGCDRPSDKFELSTTPDCDRSVEQRLRGLGIANRHPLVVLSPGAKYGASKCWPPKRYAAVADLLTELHDAAVVITCGPGEEPIAREIKSAMKREAALFDRPLLSLGELKSLIAHSDLLVCNDAGPRHIAKAFNVPVVTVFGPTHPEWTATEYAAERVVRINVDCGPCQKRVCPLEHLNCMTGVTADMVLAAAKELLLMKEISASGQTRGTIK